MLGTSDQANLELYRYLNNCTEGKGIFICPTVWGGGTSTKWSCGTDAPNQCLLFGFN